MSIDKNEFLNNFKDQFDLLDDDVAIDMDTEFRSLEDWDSLVALSVIAMADDEYGVELNGDDIRGSKSVKDLFELIETRHS